MSQGDPTFNATHQIEILVRELRHCPVDSMGDIIKAIRVLRRHADYLEAHPTWTAGSSDAVRRILQEAGRYARSHEDSPLTDDEMGRRLDEALVAAGILPCQQAGTPKGTTTFGGYLG